MLTCDHLFTCGIDEFMTHGRAYSRLMISRHTTHVENLNNKLAHAVYLNLGFLTPEQIHITYGGQKKDIILSFRANGRYIICTLPMHHTKKTKKNAPLTFQY